MQRGHRVGVHKDAGATGKRVECRQQRKGAAPVPLAPQPDAAAPWDTGSALTGTFRSCN